MTRPSICPIKTAQSAEIDRQTADYIARGGTVEVLPSFVSSEYKTITEAEREKQAARGRKGHASR